MKKILARSRSLNPPARRLRSTAVALLALLLSAATLPAPASAAGELDPSFGTGGFVMTDLGGYETADYAAVQPDGRIVVVGGAAQGTGPSLLADVSLLRYRADGALDTAFGNGGKVILDFGNTADVPTGVCLQADGKIIVVGTSYSPTTEADDLVLARFNADGTPDASYGTGGRVKVNLKAPLPAYTVTALIQPDGRVIAAGVVYTSNDPQPFESNFFATRINADGTLDTTFGTQGRATVDIMGFDIVTGIALQADGRILLAGMAGVSPNTGPTPTFFALARLKADGTPDPTFDGDGRLTTTFFGRDFANGVAVQADGKLVVAGETSRAFPNSTEPDFALARYETNGVLDLTFGTEGRLTLDFDFGADTA
ncbi:MAG: delta-60 repeat domain-containing protein, partial [Pyrinomonadaceae bacterium]